MKYFVTYAAMDGELANPLWHACIMLSQAEENKKMEVINQWGFYGLPTTERESKLSYVKIKLGVDVDFTGNHGMLRPEAIRDLDRGSGLRGVTFELTEERFERLKKKCRQMVSDQDQAINEAVSLNKLPAKSKSKTRIYPYEHHGRVINYLENNRAQETKSPPRLKPFTIDLGFSITGPDLTRSHTCKSQIIELLQDVITSDQIARLTQDGQHPTVPRLSGKMEKIYLHSEGPLSEHKRRNGELAYYRDGNSPEVKLYWSFPPQEIVPLSEETLQLTQQNPNDADEAKTLISALQKIEWILINANLASQHENDKHALISKIRHAYEAFAIIPPVDWKKPRVTGLKGAIYSLFHQPINENETVLFKSIARAKYILEKIFYTLSDQWLNDLINDITPYNVFTHLKNEEQKKINEVIGSSRCIDSAKSMTF